MSPRHNAQRSFDFSAGIRSPLVIAYGLGVDSTAMLVGYWRRGIRPDLILFSDTGSEREATYNYLPIINTWLSSVGFPSVTVVSYKAKNFKFWPPYHTLEENILTNVALPSISYGGHACSSKWKITAQDRFLDGWAMAKDAWSAGVVVRRAVGFEESPHERKRAQRCSTFSVQDLDDGKYNAVFPLQEWHWDRARCIEEIKAAGLPAPSKSSCYFCAAMKPWEVDELTPGKLMRIVIIEARTSLRHLDYAKQRAEDSGQPWDGKPLIAGIWRKAVKGTFANGQPNGAQKRPGSMTEYIRENGLLPSSLIDALIALTPTCHFTKEDFEREGLAGWQDWIARICRRAHEKAGLEPRAAA
jgi:3'-phosphoadenosine 5'-phosphosulfate sulfotransferase (PAPS reductase)/FAD synthetase